MSARASFPLRPASFIALACLMILGLQGWTEWHARATQLEVTKSSLTNLATSLTQHTEDTIDVADSLLTSLVEQLENNEISPKAMAGLNQKLAAQIVNQPRYHSVTVLDENGDWLASSLPVMGGNLADHAYFGHHREDRDRGLLVGLPIKDPQNGNWVITVSRRFRSASGGFGGVVLAVIDLSYFTSLYAAYDLGPNSGVFLLTTNGILLARQPSSSLVDDKTYPGDAILARLQEHSAGVFASTAFLDGKQRFVGYHESDRYPLIALVAMSEDHALGAWSANARLHMIIAALLVVAVGWLSLHLIRQVRRSQEAEERVRESEARYRLQAETLRQANERVTLATESGAIGLWEWDISESRMTWDRGMYRLHDIPSETGASYEVWSRDLHPEDREAAEQEVRDSRESGKPYVSAYRIIWRDGSVRHLSAVGRATRDAAGTTVRMAGACWDVTELAERNRRLAEAEREISAIAARYRLLADNATDMIVVLDQQQNYRYASPACRELLGYAPEDLTHAPASDTIHPDDAQQVAAIIAALSTGPGRAAATYRARHRDGHWVWVDAAFKLIRDPDTGAPLEICGALRDVTQRVQTETALRESEERWNLLVQSGCAEALCMLDPDGCIETWNPGAERIKGYTAQEIIGRNFSIFFTPEDIARGEPRRVLDVARDTGRFTAEAWRVRKDGSRFVARVVLDAVHRQDGSLRGFAKVTHDVTTQRIEEEQRSIIIEAAPNGMMIVDEAGTITLANAQLEHIFDYPRGTLTGQAVEILLPEAFRAAHMALRTAFTEGRSDQSMSAAQSFTGRKRDGSPVPVEIMLSPVQTPRGAIVVASLYDVTERLRLAAEQHEVETRARLAVEANNANLNRLSRHLAKARDRAEQANRAKSRFLAGMSHELRTPLNGVLGYAQLLRMEGDLNPRQVGRVDAMLEAGKHLLQMITRVLDMSEIEAERIELKPIELEPLVIAEACIDFIRPSAEAKGLALRITEVSVGQRKLVADPMRLRQILLNLLGNAAKFTSAGSIELRLRPAADGAFLRIEVADTGPGIQADQCQRLFQDFERLDTDATRMVEGAGLGLALSARLAGIMGGRLGYEDNPGGGSVFWLELPLTLPDTAMPALASAAEGQVTQLAPKPVRVLNILVVDDIAINRDIAGSFVRTAGHKTSFANSGGDAVAAAASEDFDVILMDVRMPGMDGLEATRRIRGLDGPCARVPIVALTALAFTDQVEECRKAGMDTHLTKPFELETLMAAINRAMEARRPSDWGNADGPSSSHPAQEPADAELPVFDPETFAHTAAVLSPETVTAYLRTIADQGDSLLHRLRETDALTENTEDLAAAAHTLSGSAGLFGFARLVASGRYFERALQLGGSDIQALADRLCNAIEAMQKEIAVRLV